MQLTITVTDERSDYQYGTRKTETYDRVKVEGLTGNGSVLAGFLRTVADDIDPRPEPGPVWDGPIAEVTR
jgi:hypothetical protein